MYKSGFISCKTDTFGRMDNSSQLKIRWNNFPLTVSSSLEALRNNGDLVDTSLFCEGRRFLVSDTVCFRVEMQWICSVTSFLFIIKAHRVVLSATSNYFRQIFKEIASPNVAIVLSGLNHQDIDALLTFIYSGEVSLCEPQLASFLKTAETLQVCQFDCHPLSINSKMFILVNYISRLRDLAQITLHHSAEIQKSKEMKPYRRLNFWQQLYKNHWPAEEQLLLLFYQFTLLLPQSRQFQPQPLCLASTLVSQYQTLRAALRAVIAAVSRMSVSEREN